MPRKRGELGRNVKMLHATCVLMQLFLLGKIQNDRQQLFLIIMLENFVLFLGGLIKYSRIFLVEPLQVVVFHVFFSVFVNGWIGNHLHTNEHRQYVIEHETKVKLVSECVLLSYSFLPFHDNFNLSLIIHGTSFNSYSTHKWINKLTLMAVGHRGRLAVSYTHLTLPTIYSV